MKNEIGLIITESKVYKLITTYAFRNLQGFGNEVAERSTLKVF